MGYMDDLSRDGVSRLTGQRPQLAGSARVPALQVPLYTPESVPLLEGPSSGAQRLAGPSNVPARQAPWYTPEQPPRLAAPAEAPTAGPLSRASRLAVTSGAAGLLAGGAAATEAATGTVAANPDYFKNSIGDDGLAANILLAADSRRESVPAQQATPRIAQLSDSGASGSASRGASGDWMTASSPAMSDAGAGRGSINPMSVQAAPPPQYDDRFRAANLTNMQNEAYREGDPIGDIIRQKLGPQGGAQSAQGMLAAGGGIAGGGIIGGGDTTYSPGMAARTDPFQTADGRKLDANDPNLSDADRSAIGQYRASNAQMAADIERQQRTNPLAGAVQIIRPGNDVSYAVQGADRMIEIEPDAYGAYQSAIAKNPQLGARMQMAEGGMRVDGMLAPPNLADAGEGALKGYAQALQKSTLNAADPLAAKTAAEIEVERVKNQGTEKVAEIAAGAKRRETAAAGNKQSFDMENKLFDDHKGQSKTFIDVRDAYTRLDKSLEKATTSAAGTLAGATVFMKLLDPGSVVRESELGMALAATGALDRASNYITVLQKGKVLTEDQAKDFRSIGADLYKAAEVNQRTLDGEYGERAKVYGLNPKNIVGDYYYKKPEEKQKPDAAGGKPAAAAQPTRKTVGDRTFENDGKGWYEVK